MHNDSVKKTLFIATMLCLCCSIFVAIATVRLKPLQDENKRFDIKEKLLFAAGLVDKNATKDDVLSAYKKVTPILVELDSGSTIEDVGFDLKKSLKDVSLSHRIKVDDDHAGILRRANHARVFIVKDDDEIKQYIFPIYGKGLWSTMYGFLALDSSFKTVLGIGFYEHGETPGLGGEIENSKWQKSWVGKVAYSDDLMPLLTVIKGKVDASLESSKYQIDGLSGATLTTKGVANTLKFWLGENGFLPFVRKELERGVK